MKIFLIFEISKSNFITQFYNANSCCFTFWIQLNSFVKILTNLPSRTDFQEQIVKNLTQKNQLKVLIKRVLFIWYKSKSYENTFCIMCMQKIKNLFNLQK